MYMWKTCILYVWCMLRVVLQFLSIHYSTSNCKSIRMSKIEIYVIILLSTWYTYEYCPFANLCGLWCIINPPYRFSKRWHTYAEGKVKIQIKSKKRGFRLEFFIFYSFTTWLIHLQGDNQCVSIVKVETLNNNETYDWVKWKIHWKVTHYLFALTQSVIRLSWK